MTRALIGCVCLSVSAISLAQPQRPKVLPPEVLSPLAMEIGTNADFQNAVFTIEKDLESGSFDRAKQGIKLLPHREIRVEWDDHNVPERLREIFSHVRNDAAEGWGKSLGLKFDFISGHQATMPDIRIGFEPVLNQPAGASAPLPIALFFSAESSSPRLDVVIGLKRGSRLRPTTDADVYAEVAFALGQYFGLAESKIPSTVMYRLDTDSPHTVQVTQGERVSVSHIFELIELLTNYADQKQKVSAGLSSVFVDPTALDPGKPQLQGDTINFTVQVTNRGVAPMQTRLVPDCNCFSTTDPQVVPPGGTVLYPVAMNSILYEGDVHKALTLISSDPIHPYITIPVHVFVTPRYRLLTPSGDTILADDDMRDFPVYLAFDGPVPDVDRAELSGIRGHVTYEKWTGVLPDPQMNEPPRKRTGYKLVVSLDRGVPRGSPIFVGINVSTTDPSLRTINCRIFAQNGIVCAPNPMYCGHIARVQRQFNFVVARPGKPFKIIGLFADDKHIKLTQNITPGKPWEHTVHVVFDGLAPEGDYAANITIKTDDKSQPTLVELFSANVD